MKLRELLDLVDLSLKVKIMIDGYAAEGSVRDIKLIDIKGVVKSISIETIPYKKLVVYCDSELEEK